MPFPSKKTKFVENFFQVVTVILSLLALGYNVSFFSKTNFRLFAEVWHIC